MLRRQFLSMMWSNAEFFSRESSYDHSRLPLWSGLSFDCWQRYPLHYVVASGSLGEIERAFDQYRFSGYSGGDAVEEASVSDWRLDTLETPLDVAVQRGEMAIVEFLLARGARPSTLTMLYAKRCKGRSESSLHRQQMQALHHAFPSTKETEKILRRIAAEMKKTEVAELPSSTYPSVAVLEHEE
eukprot:NODE_5358_length_686_cov_14.794349_g4984_i0.p1 GENE.NODE_5358_length_686_cov_14.794349_g4984_i0~~NODE_5358_length_686_cov_14.794349_g4984_i0.p1  ORF type:complete len:185 (-),score=28.03 NODE_5358_length_686_cov_14.794349_g4984_i0:19-573(-)